MGCVSCVQSWLEKPINFSKEKSQLSICTAVALLAIGFATYCYFYNGPLVEGATEGYKIGYAYAIWGITAGAIVFTTVAYVARAILSHKKLQAEEQKNAQLRKGIKEAHEKNFNRVFKKLFPDVEIANLPEFHENLCGTTGYIDQTAVLQRHFKEHGGNIVRATQDNRPFIALNLYIETKTKSYNDILLIAPNPNGQWYISASLSYHILMSHLYTNIMDQNENSSLCLDWLVDIMNGTEKPMLEWKKRKMVESHEATKARLWRATDAAT